MRGPMAIFVSIIAAAGYAIFIGAASFTITAILNFQAHFLVCESFRDGEQTRRLRSPLPANNRRLLRSTLFEHLER